LRNFWAPDLLAYSGLASITSVSLIVCFQTVY